MASVLVGAVGYHNLTNFSIGPLLLPELQRMEWPDGFRVEELNWGPIAVVQELQARPPLDRVVLLGARPSSLPEGRMTCYRWRGGLPEPDEIQARIAEAVTGVISLDNLLVIGQHFKVWPAEVFVVDVAPGAQACGNRLRPAVQAHVPSVLQAVRNLALHGVPEDSGLPSLRGDRLSARERPAAPTASSPAL